MTDEYDGKYGVGVRIWVQTIRMARIGRTTTGVAYALATYADFETGRRVKPGLSRLSVECELDYNTVQKAVSVLHKAGLLSLVRKATTRDGADEYRLIMHEELLERIEILTVAALDTQIEQVRRRKTGRYRGKNLHPSAVGADESNNDDLHPSRQGAGDVDGPVDSAVDNAPLHPSAVGAGVALPEKPAPIGTVSKTGPAPIGTCDLHPSAMVPITQEEPQELPPIPVINPRSDVTVVGATLPDETTRLLPVIKPRTDGGRHAADEPEPEPEPAADNVIKFPDRRTA